MEILNHEIYEIIIPRVLIFRNKLYKITKLAEKFYIKGYIVETVDSNVDRVILDAPHPNANPRTGEFCIAHDLRKHKLTETAKLLIQSMLSQFNLDDCYFTPWDEIEYKAEV